MAENAHKPEKAEPCCSAVQHPKLISLSEEHSNLISVANKVFGEGKWSHTVVKQILDFQYIDSNEVDSDNEYFDDEINVRNNNKYSAKCVSYIKIQLENGNCYEDDGFYIAEESTEGLSMQNARIGSTVSALKKVLLSFGDKVERELQQLQRQISSEQVNTFAAAEPMDLAINFHDLISVANKIFGEGKWNHTVVRQTLDSLDDGEFSLDEEDREKYCAGCVSYVKIQLENGNFHEDIGYFDVKEWKGLSIQTVRIGSATNALFRVLLSFGDKVERELKLRRQIGYEQVNTFTAAEPMDVAMNFYDLISMANKVFGEGKWNHTVVSQTLDFIDTYDINYTARDRYDQDKSRIGCVSFVKVQLENGNFHGDVGYFNAEELTRGLSTYNARIGSAVNALKRVLLSFGDKVERELQQLQRQISSDQEPMDLAADFPDLISAANKVFGEGKWNHTVVSQTLDFEDANYDALNDPRVYHTGCVSFVKVQLENGNFHEDVGYFNAEEPTKGLSIYSARIGSAINALKRVLLSFGDKVERELQQLRRQISSDHVSMFATTEPMDLAADFPDLISAANKVFGEGKWNHTVVSQTLDFKDANYDALNDPRYHTGCVSFVKVQLENGNFHEDVGYFNAEEPTKGLSIHSATIGSAINALKRVLLSFGDKVERELQQLRRQISSDHVSMFATTEPMDLAADFPDLISAANKVFGEGKWNHTVVSQTLDFKDANYDALNDPRYHTSCVSFVKVQLENGNFHEDVGYFNAEEPTKGLSIYSARIGSAINALKRVLLSFGDKVERELQQLRRQISSDHVSMFATTEPMDLAADFPDLISAANKVFGEGKWNHTVVSQTLDFKDANYDALNDPRYHTGYVSFVKVQLENGNFHEDVGYFNAEEPTKGLSIYSARIGSAINALKRVLLSFGDKVERELQQLRRQISSDHVSMFATTEPMDLAADFPDLISAANKVFGEGKWNHTVVSQTLDFKDANYDALNDPRYHTGCVSFVKVQLENGNFHEDVGYFNAEEFTQGLSIYNARIGSAVNALRRVLLSFGEKIDKELQRQVIPKQVSDIKRNATQSLVNTFVTAEPMDLIAELPDLISAANKVFGEGNWRHTVVKQTLDFDYVYHVDYSHEIYSDDDEFDDIIHDEINARNKYSADCVSYVKVQLKNENFHMDVGYCSTKEPTRGLAILNAKIGSAVNALKRVLMSFGEKVERELQRQINLEQTNDVQDVTQSLDKQISEKLNVSDPTLVPTVNNDITEIDPSSFVKVQSSKIVHPSPNKTNFTSE
ncbi:uncharacterized protein [Temnothorax longispinosus]|uniref:uncharacterized protein n=1 Tax=Temnothorax longispinosus TaxID=300112 RepID=UPI003A993DEB